MDGCGDGRVLGAYGRDESHPTVWVVLFGSTVSERLSFSREELPRSMIKFIV